MTTVKEGNVKKGLLNRIKSANMFKDWTLFEKLWVVIFTVIELYLFFAWKDSAIGLIASLTGMYTVVLVAKGKISNYFFGIVNALTYGYVAYTYGLYGEASLNLLFYFPTQFIGLFLWKRNIKKQEEAENGEEIYAKRLSLKGIIITTVVVILGAVAYAEILYFFNAQQVRLDSFAVVLSVTAQILMLKRYAEQWVLWILVNVLSITMWAITLAQSGGNDWNMVVMYSAFLINSIYGYVNWLRISKK